MDEETTYYMLGTTSCTYRGTSASLAYDFPNNNLWQPNFKYTYEETTVGYRPPYRLWKCSNDEYLCSTYDGYPLECYTVYRESTPETPIEVKRRELKSQLTIIVKSRAQEVYTFPDNELVAMQTLREMITEIEYRKYIKDGFITVRGQSGKIYQIFRERSHTKVYYQGELIEEICVRLQGNTPPTDSVIAFKTMIEVDEENFAALGNRYNMRKVA